MNMTDRRLKWLCAVVALSLLSACATVPAQMRSLRGTGIRKTIAASPDEIIDSYTGMFKKGASAGWYTLHEDDAVFAANTQIGLTEAIFLSSGTSPGSTDVEALANIGCSGGKPCSRRNDKCWR